MNVIKNIIFSFLAFIIMPSSLILIWIITNMIFEFEISAIPPIVELFIAMAEGILVPLLMLTFIFKITKNSSAFSKSVRISAIAGCIVTVLSVLLLLPWIKFGIAFRGVKM